MTDHNDLAARIERADGPGGALDAENAALRHAIDRDRYIVAAENLARLAWDKSNSETEPARVDAARAAARQFIIHRERKGPRVALSSDFGLPCPTCRQFPAALRAQVHP
jgi:hypothetical protein